MKIKVDKLPKWYGECLLHVESLSGEIWCPLQGNKVCQLSTGDKCQCLYEKEPKLVKQEEIKLSILKEVRARIERTANECETRKIYGDGSEPVLWHSKGIRDACWTIDDLIEEIEQS